MVNGDAKNGDDVDDDDEDDADFVWPLQALALSMVVS